MRLLNLRSITLCLVICFGLTGPQSSFAEEASHRAEDLAQTVFQELIQKSPNGFIEDLSLAEIHECATKVKFVSTPMVVSGSGGTRHGAIHDTEKKLVVGSILLSDGLSFPAIKALVRHELLGACGYDDEHYQMSIGLHVFEYHPDFFPIFRESFSADKLNRTEKNRAYDTKGLVLAGSGTGTSVGGGGDGVALEILLTLVDTIAIAPKEALDTLRVTQHELIGSIMKARITVDYFADHGSADGLTPVKTIEVKDESQVGLLHLKVHALWWREKSLRHELSKQLWRQLLLFHRKNSPAKP